MMEILKYDRSKEKLVVCFTGDLVWEYSKITSEKYKEIKKALKEDKSIQHLLNNSRFVGTLKEVNYE